MPTRFDHPAAWYAADLGTRDDLAITLEDRHRDALRAALVTARERGVDLAALGPDDFPLEAIAADIAAWRRELHDGRGLVLLRGFPVDGLDVEDVELLYFGFGLRFGRPVSQSKMGDLVGHVVNVGGKDRRERAYRNSRELHLHTDRCDHIGMLCLQPAWEGGISGYASGLTVHNEILASRPELLEPLYAGYHLHRFGEQPPGEPPVTRERIPVFSVADGVPGLIYIRGYIDLAESEGLVELTDREREALTYFEEVADREDVRANLTLERGDLMLCNNCLVLHTRTGFEDHPDDPSLRRHLMRLWLRQDDRPMTDGVVAHKGAAGIPGREGGGTYYAGPGGGAAAE